MDAPAAFAGGGAEPAEVAHALKAAGQDVLKETPEELLSLQTQRAGLAALPVLIGEGDGGVVTGQQAAGTEGGFLDVGRQITQGGDPPRPTGCTSTTQPLRQAKAGICLSRS